MKVVYRLLVEAKTGWKKDIHKKLAYIDESLLLQPVEILKCALRYPGWKIVELVRDRDSVDSQKEFSLSLASVGIECIYFYSVDIENQSEVVCLFNGRFATYSSPEAAENAYFDEKLDRNMCFFSDKYPQTDKLLVRIRPKSKSVHSSITNLFSRYLEDCSPDSYEAIVAYFDTELNDYSKKEDLDVYWKFPGNCLMEDKADFMPDSRLAKNLAYVYDDGKYIYVGFHHDNLGELANNDYNFGGQDGGTMLAVIDALAYMSKSVAAKARLKRFGNNNIEGYFFGSKEALYYREQVLMPEQIWGESNEA